MRKVIKKIRLKKDTPDHKAGELFGLMSNNGIYEIDAGEDDPAVFYGGDIDNFDEWFEEVKEPEWVRKQIKQILFDDTREDIIGWKYTDMRYRFIKDYYRYDSQTSFGLYENGTRTEFRFLEKTNSPERDNALHYFNQLVRDGYIEIQDNPNIVWEDEKCD